MNYRHHFHAGNAADVVKHALLVRLFRALQKKEKGFLYLDTHAGRGSYDLDRAAAGDSLARRPEWPQGIGRLLARDDLPPGLAEYVAMVREHDRRQGNVGDGLRFYPGSPALAKELARLQDRLVLCEKHPAECDSLRAAMSLVPAGSIREMDGYQALRAILPPPERRALVLIDPPYELPDELAQLARGLADGLARFPTGVFVVWYPLTERVRVEEFFSAVRALRPPPTLVAEVAFAAGNPTSRLQGCGLLVINPPWQFDLEALPLLEWLGGVFAPGVERSGRLEWLIPPR